MSLRIPFLSLLLLGASFCCTGATKTVGTSRSSGRQLVLPFQYVITCGVAVEPLRKSGAIRPNSRVSFHALTATCSDRNKENNGTYILTNIVDTGRRHHATKRPVFEAVVVDPRTWQGQLHRNSLNAINSQSKKNRFVQFHRHSKTLWCVHDERTSPREWFRQCSQYDIGGGRYTIVPVLWPADDKTIRRHLNDDIDVSPDASQVFRPLLQIAQSLQKKPAIVCHGKGIHVLKLAAASVARHASRRRSCCFDHIFMVAANIRCDLFDSVRNKNEKHVERNHGKRIAALAQRKVHNLYSTRDLVLRRHYLPWQPALGRQPIHPQKLSKDTRYQVLNHNCNAFNRLHWKTNRLRHHYLFHRDAVQYYESAMK